MTGPRFRHSGARCAFLRCLARFFTVILLVSAAAATAQAQISPSVRTAVFADGTGIATTGPFTTSAGDLVIAFASAGGPSGGGQSLTISGGGLTWARVTRANAMPGVAEIWQAPSPTAKSNISITSTPLMATYSQSLTVVTFSGAGVGASASAAGASGAPSLSLTTTRAGSLAYAVGNDWDGAIARRLGSSQSMTHQWVNAVSGDTYWVQKYSSPVANAGTAVQLNDPTPDSDRWNFAGIEIVPTGAVPSITLGAATGSTGGTVAATVTNGPGAPGDWVGLYDAGGNAVNWQYLNGTQVIPATGVTSATLTLMLPVTPGTYQARFFNAAYILLAISGSITTTAPSLTLSATTGATGGTVTATVANGPGAPGDWVGLYDAGGNAVSWQYLNGTQVKPATGVTNATVIFMLPATPGIYQARFMSAAYMLLATSGSITITAPTVTLNATTGSAGGPVTATITNAPGTTGDWAGLYDAGGNAISWQYLNGTQIIPASGVTSAVLTFTLPPTPGTYRVRLCNASYVWVASSGPITSTLPTVTLSATTGNAGGTVTATIANAPGTPGDWIGLYATGGATAVNWQYLNGTQVKPATGVTTAVLTLQLPSTAGTYQVRLFNAAYVLVATSASITVTLPSVTLSAGTGAAGGLVTATVANAPGTPGDWVGLYDAGGNVITWKYLNGTQTIPATGVANATVTFMLPATAGTYQVRLFNGSYVQLAASGSVTTTVATLTLSATTVSVGGTVTVTIANAPGTPGDWAGLYDAAGNAMQWQYLNGTQTAPAVGVSSATLTFTIPLTPGTYRIRLFNATYTLITTSAAVVAS